MLDQQIIALLGFGAAAWQAAPRDNYIGWIHALRKQHLQLIVNISPHWLSASPR